MTTNDLLDCDFFGTANSKDDYFKYSENELEKMWTYHPETKPFYFGSYGLIIWRKDFLKFRDNFTYIDNLSIVDNLDKNGNGGVNASSWDFLSDFFTEKYRKILSDLGQKTFSVKSIVREG